MPCTMCGTDTFAIKKAYSHVNIQEPETGLRAPIKLSSAIIATVNVTKKVLGIVVFFVLVKGRPPNRNFDNFLIRDPTDRGIQPVLHVKFLRYIFFYCFFFCSKGSTWKARHIFATQPKCFSVSMMVTHLTQMWLTL